MRTYTMNVPVPFPGTYDEAAANFDGHWFAGEDGRCMDCDARVTHEAANYPCGANVPRMDVIVAR